MKTVYKYPLELVDMQSVQIPFRAELLTARMQNGKLYLWANVETDWGKTDRFIRIMGTGHPLKTDNDVRYISTFMMDDGSLVFHVFEVL